MAGAKRAHDRSPPSDRRREGRALRHKPRRLRGGFHGIPRRAGRPLVLNGYSEYRSQNPRGFYVAGTRERLRLIFAFVSGAADALRNRRVPASEHRAHAPATAADPTAIQGGPGARRPGAGRHDSRGAHSGTKFPACARRIPAAHCHQSLPSVVAWLPHQAVARTGGNAMRWIHDACGNADLEEVAFAGKDVSAILEHVDSPPRRGTLRTLRRARTL